MTATNFSEHFLNTLKERINTWILESDTLGRKELRNSSYICRYKLTARSTTELDAMKYTKASKRVMLNDSVSEQDKKMSPQD